MRCTLGCKGNTNPITSPDRGCYVNARPTWECAVCNRLYVSDAVYATTSMRAVRSRRLHSEHGNLNIMQYENLASIVLKEDFK